MFIVGLHHHECDQGLTEEEEGGEHQADHEMQGLAEEVGFRVSEGGEDQ